MANVLMKALNVFTSPAKRKAKHEIAFAEPVKHYTFMLRAGDFMKHVSIVAFDRVAAEQKLVLEYPNYIVSFLWEYIRTTPAERAAVKRS